MDTLGFTGQRLRKYQMIHPQALPSTREYIVNQLIKQQARVNQNARKKAQQKVFEEEQARLLQAEYEKEIKKQEKERQKERMRLEVQKQQEEAKAKALAKKLNYQRGAQKRAIKKLGSNVIADLSGTLHDFDTQISLPLQIALNKLKGVAHAYLQITVNGATITSKLIDVQGNDGSAIWWNNIHQELVVYEHGLIVERIGNGASFHIVIVKADSIPSKKLQQIFREGETHCVIEPLYVMWKTYAENATTDGSKKRLQQIANKLKAMEKVYPNGVPEKDMELVAKACNRCIILHDIIGNEIKRYNPSSTMYVHFTNTRENHVDQGHITLDNKFDYVSAEEMKIILNEHNDNNEFYLFDGDIKNGIARRIRSARGAWVVKHPEQELFSDFSKSQGINNYGLNAVDYPELNAFIKEARIIHSAPTPLCDEPNQIEGVQHYDVEKAYTQHKYAPFYKGFLGHITNWRRLTKCSSDFIATHVGIYQFQVVTNPSELLRKLGLHIGKQYTLPSPEIEYFMSLGMTIKLLAGCWGSTFDIEYSNEMLDQRRYCIWAGKLGQDQSYHCYTMKGGLEWASHLKSELGEDNVLYFSEEKMIVVKIPKKSYHTRHHILGFITSYTRLNMLKLMSEVKGELIKVIMDGLYFRGVLPDVEIPCKSKEIKEHIGFRDAWYHESIISTSSWEEYNYNFDGSAILAGAGGTGKSTHVVKDRGLIEPLYIVPSHVLGRKMNMEHGIQYTTIHKFIGIECRPWKDDHYEPHVAFIDELTMMESDWLDKAIQMYPHTMFLIAGDVDEKQWFQCRNGCPGKFSNIWKPTGWKYVHYTTDYRSQDEELKAFKVAIRQEMRNIFTDGNSIDTLRMKLFLQQHHSCISFDEAVPLFTQGSDTWIAGTHKTNEKLLARGIVSGFINADKEIVKEGEGEKRGAFTIHSYQGLTIKTGKVFISLDMFEYAMLYTAISRCVNMNQIVLVK